MFFRATWLKRVFSELLGINSSDIPDIPVEPRIRPVINLEPEVIIRSAINISQGTPTVLYTTPTDKDFFLVSAAMGNVSDLGNDTGVITAYLAENGILSNLCAVTTYGGTLNAQQQSIFYGKRGVKIARGVAIEVNFPDSQGANHAIITGYVAGDR